ncbi:MAG: hypothetical protein AB7O26_15090 [Planctomycetaceae bacterium]
MSTSIPKDSKDVAKRIKYELHMFDWLAKDLIAIVHGGAASPSNVQYSGTAISDEEAAALLESFLLHARVLYSFFCVPAKYQDDLIASDWVRQWSPLPTPYLDSNRTRLNKALAHLSLKRAEYEIQGKQWNITDIQSEIYPLIAKFKNELPPPKNTWF